MSTKIKNPVTGNDVIVTTCILKAVTSLSRPNKNGNKSRFLHIQVLNKRGEPQIIGGFIPEKSLAMGTLVEGETYGCRIEKVPGRINPWVTVSPFTTADRATNDMWDWSGDYTEAPAAALNEIKKSVTA